VGVGFLSRRRARDQNPGLRHGVVAGDSVSSFAVVVDETGTDAGTCTIAGLPVPV
jgi:hypothetical protein